MRICDYVVKTYFETVFAAENVGINQEDKDILIHFARCALFGLYID